VKHGSMKAGFLQSFRFINVLHDEGRYHSLIRRVAEEDRLRGNARERHDGDSKEISVIE